MGGVVAVAAGVDEPDLGVDAYHEERWRGPVRSRWRAGNRIHKCEAPVGNLEVEYAATDFGEYVDSTTLPEKVSSWVATRLNYVPVSSDLIGGAVDTPLAGAGVCRDFAHLALALLRAVRVPAYSSVSPASPAELVGGNVPFPQLRRRFGRPNSSTRQHDVSRASLRPVSRLGR